jgi:hypothetical protein
MTFLQNSQLFDDIRSVLSQAKNHVIQTVNTTMVATYFQIGKLIVEDEQK